MGKKGTVNLNVKAKPKISVKAPSNKKKNESVIKTTRTDKLGKYHSGKGLMEGDCIFPFIFKKKKHYNCIDTGRGGWCATKLKPNGTLDKYAYCIE